MTNGFAAITKTTMTCLLIDGWNETEQNLEFNSFLPVENDKIFSTVFFILKIAILILMSSARADMSSSCCFARH